MPDTRWRKVWRDIALQRARSALVALALATGLAGAGAVLDTWALVRRATVEGYRASLPVSATLALEAVDDDAAERVLALARAEPGVVAARLRRVVDAQAQGQGAWQPALLVAADEGDPSSASIGRLRPEGGPWPPPDGSVAVERSSLDFGGVLLGQPISMRLNDDAGPRPALVSSIVRDVSLAPGWMEHRVVVFATRATLARLGAGTAYNELQIRVADAAADRAAVRRIAVSLRQDLTAAGWRVRSLDVPEPGQHVHAAQMDSLLLTQGAFGMLALAVCALLVLNLFAALLAGQARQIGVMKVLGASSRALSLMYVAQAAVLGLVASSVALPLAAVAGYRYAALKAELLNFPLDGLAIPAWAFALQCAVGVLVPVLAVAAPVRRACHATVAQALHEVGLGGGALPLRAGLVAHRSRPLLLALGNALRQRRRMLLTLLALAAGGAVMVGAANLRRAISVSIDHQMAGQGFNVTLRLGRAVPVAQAEAAAHAVEGVRAAEAWRASKALLADGDDAFTLVGVPEASTLLRPPLRSGRWLHDGDRDALVLSLGAARSHPAWQPGQTLWLTIDGEPQPWAVVGLVDTGAQAVAYVPRGALDALLGERGGTTLVAALEPGSAVAQRETVARLRGALVDAGIPIAASQLRSEARRAVEDHLAMVVDFLAAMGWLMLAIGGVGLASAMGLNLLERRREIGVLRAIGASDGRIVALVQIEGLAITALAWLACLPLSVPMGLLLGEAFGRIMFPVPPAFWPEPVAALRWGLAMLAISCCACAWPAWRATRMPVAAALAYE